VAALAATLEAVIPCHAQMPVLGQIACDPDRHGRIEALLIEGHTDVRVRRRPPCVRGEAREDHPCDWSCNGL
jgi:hypothetical protein